MDTVLLRLHARDVEKAYLRLWIENAERKLPMERVSDELFACSLKLPENPCLVWYYFIGESKSETRYLGNAPDNLGGEGQMYDHEPPSFQITVYDPAYQPPEWMRNGIFYQIMPDRFAPTEPKPDWLREPQLIIDPATGDNVANDHFGGTLDGVRLKLPYLQSLGVTAIYLNPIFEAHSNHKYDTGDYETVDARFGGNEAFEKLTRACKRRGMKLILDGVFSHTGSDSRYFNKLGRYESLGAYQSKESPYYRWYEFEEYPDKYKSWWGFDTLPTINKLDPGYQAYMLEGRDAIARRWLRAGATGWRLDVADELPMPFLRKLREAVRKQKKDGALIGEVWEDASRKVCYGELRCYCLGDTLDSVTNYPLLDALTDFLLGRLSAPEAARRIEAMREAYPRPFLCALLNMTGSHDRPRTIELLGGTCPRNVPRAARTPTRLPESAYSVGKRRMIALHTFLCAIPGLPCVYYGDEAGLAGMDDPYNRRPYPWGGEDEEMVEAFRANHLRRTSDPIWTEGEWRIEPDGDNRLVSIRTLPGREARAALDRNTMTCEHIPIPHNA